tara:strand:- start:15400 stop:15588 length:189 start_codon:yes stop_codon:yes gene_type:complete
LIKRIKTMSKDNKIDKILNQNARNKNLNVEVKKEKKIEVLEEELKNKKKEIKSFFNEMFKDD